MRQGLCAIGATLALLCAIVVVAVYAHSALRTDTPQGGVRVHLTDNGTVVSDPWCMRSEDSCRMNFRPSGQWVITRVTP